MKKIALLTTLLFGLFFIPCNSKNINTIAFQETIEYKKQGMYAKITTNKGEINISLTYDKTPITVANFICLVEGLLPQCEGAFYDGLKFHRVIPDFMIQGGCPLGTGMGDPGYKFIDEFHPDLKHDRAGILSMANSGPNTNGSQFFITHKETPWLDNKHTVFGAIDIDDTNSQNVVDNIVQDDMIEKIEIIRRGVDAKKFDALNIFNDYMKNKKKKELEIIALQQKKLADISKGAKKTDTGLMYKVINKGDGKDHPNANSQVTVHYHGTKLNGEVFDSSVDRGTPATFPLDRVIPGWTEGVQLMVEGDKWLLIIPSDLAYGARGVPQAGIGPNETLVFEVELIEIVK